MLENIIIKSLEEKNKFISNLINNTDDEVMKLITIAPMFFTIIHHIIESKQLENFLQFDKCILNYDMKKPSIYMINVLIIFFALKQTDCNENLTELDHYKLNLDEIKKIRKMMEEYETKIYPVINDEIKELNKTITLINIHEDYSTDDIFISFDNLFSYYVLIFINNSEKIKKYLQKIAYKNIMQFKLKN